MINFKGGLKSLGEQFYWLEKKIKNSFSQCFLFKNAINLTVRKNKKSSFNI